MLRLASRFLTAAVVGCLCLTAVAEDTLSSAYAAILRGDYRTGLTILEKLDRSSAGEDIRATEGWVESYDALMGARRTMKEQTLEWNREQGRAALADGKRFLALSFAAQAREYAVDREEFRDEPWVQEISKQALEDVAKLEAAERWTKALSYLALLSRVHEDDKSLEERRDKAARHARIALLYKDDAALKEHIRGVNRDLLNSAVRLIDRMYFTQPDFKKAARGGISNLLAVCQSSKLRGYLNGLANSRSREHFMTRLTELHNQVEGATTFTHRDMLRLFGQIAEANRASVELPEGLLVVEFLDGADPELDDYTSIIWPSESRDFDKVMMGGFEGVGIQLGLDERTNRLKVVTPLENSPALEAGIQPDDLIVGVDAESTKGWTTDDAVRKIMGKAGSEVVLKILRPRTGQEIAFKLTRRSIELTSVRGVKRSPTDANAWDYMLDKPAGVAYIRLTNFLPRSKDELDQALRDARRQGMRGLVLDVRHNPGGLLDVVVEIVSEFLERGEVVSTRGRTDSESRQRIGARPEYKDLPLIVLVNDASASASEILAGALQDHNRAMVLGERTFGKGSVQHVRPLSDEARMKLTTALYYLPSGRSPHRLPDAESWGVEPDIALELTPKEFRRVLERERESYIIHNERPEGDNKVLSDEERDRVLTELRSDEESEDDETPLLSDADIKALEADPHAAPDIDPQLETAVLMMRVKLVAGLPWPKHVSVAEKTPE